MRLHQSLTRSSLATPEGSGGEVHTTFTSLLPVYNGSNGCIFLNLFVYLFCFIFLNMEMNVLDENVSGSVWPCIRNHQKTKVEPLPIAESLFSHKTKLKFGHLVCRDLWGTLFPFWKQCSTARAWEVTRSSTLSHTPASPKPLSRSKRLKFLFFSQKPSL